MEESKGRNIKKEAEVVMILLKNSNAVAFLGISFVSRKDSVSTS